MKIAILAAAAASLIASVPGTATAQDSSMSFFVTSVGSGNGGNLGGLSGAGNITTNSQAGTLTVGTGNATSTFSGVIGDTVGFALGLNKVGTGTLTLSGSNSYSGGTTLNTGTIVIGGNVRVTPAAVTHGSLTVKVNENPTVTPNSNVAMNGNQTVVTPAAPTVTPNSQISVDQPNVRAFVFDAGVSLSSLVDAINAVGASASDLVAILDALHEAGALHAELLVI